MCGIAALFQPGRRFDDVLLQAMEQDLFHRGPDSGGTVSLEEPGGMEVLRMSAH